MIPELVYKGETEGKICSICKLTFNDNETILFCSTCGSLFHEEHLISWLSNHSECPVCAKDFSKEIKKYSLRNYYNDSNQVEITQSANLPKIKFKYRNPEPTKYPRLVHFIMIISGISLVFLSVGVLPLLIPFPLVLPFSLFNYILYFIGLILIQLSKTKCNKNIDSYWKYITFSERGIIVESIDSSTKEILIDDILTIKLVKGDKVSGLTSVPNFTKKDYFIQLEITTQKKRKFNFDFIMSSTSIGLREQVYRDLHSHIKSLYNIEVIQTEISIRNYFRENRKFVLVSGLIFLLMNAILIPIGYFLIWKDMIL